jgi:hypothetical protein
MKVKDRFSSESKIDMLYQDVKLYTLKSEIVKLV